MSLTPKGLPLPAVVHAVLDPKALQRGRAIIVGDVHGCPDELDDLLAKCSFVEGTDKLILVGDIVGKGLQSAKAVQRARQLQAASVRGNWDEDALLARQLQRHGAAVPAQHASFIDTLTPEDWHYLEQLPFSLFLPSHGVLVTHAGMLPSLPLHRQDLANLVDMRHVEQVDLSDTAQGWKILPKFPRNAGHPWASVYEGEAGHVVFGHHARRRLQKCKHATGIDTGCVLGDKLTALVLPSLTELEARGFNVETSGLQHVTRKLLGAELVSVSARKQYSA